ncbi:gliding motility-associated C-terminal domain-containing protein [Chitinophaga sp. Cy-1792]|uniref:Ig-like domain-containing protein n=1 Tax=Chitinophaga sp. Cy-1792 TaxID=2608339 RepID=UPI00142446BC|nr:gliding motility-associated C-terminal domain-containing protein [Chitinophaga sp. Cy-1792]NIG52604.1 T9SS type B sorting domain-containing protein [Chitinophaga sp. Cy-1792]
MHSKATPNSPFSASFVILKTWNGSSPKPRKNLRFDRWWKSLLSVLLILGFSSANVNAQTYYQRVYANSQTNTSGALCVICTVTNPGNAVDAGSGSLSTYSTLTAGLALLSGVEQTLIFPTPVPAGTRAIVKIGTGGALLSANLGAITMQAKNNTTNVGSAYNVNAALVNLLAATNQAEIYLPAQTTAYDRITISIAGLLNVATSLNVYAAYYNTVTTTPLTCDTALDVIYGSRGSLDAVNAAAVGSIDNPYNAIDNSLTTFATMNASVGLLGYTRLSAVYPGLSKVGDSVKIVMGTPGALLSLDALNNITIVTSNGQTTVDSINASSALLQLRLLSGPSSPQVFTFASSGQFDHIEIRFSALASVLAGLRVYDMGRVIPSPVLTAASLNQATCLNTPVTFTVQNPDASLKYTWYDAAGNILQGPSATSTYTPPVNIAGSFTYYVSATRSTCPSGSQKTPVSLLVKAYTAATDINFPDTAYGCQGDTVRITPYSTLLTKPVFTWYKDAGKTTPITNGMVDGALTYQVDPVTAKLTIIGLGSGTAIFYISASDSTHCDNLANTLKKVTVIMTGKAPVPTLGATTVYGTLGQAIILRATPPAGGTVVWYKDTTQAPIAFGDTLSVVPTTANTPNVYFAGVRLSTGGTCESYHVADTAIALPPVTNTSCNAPTSTITGTTLGCVLCSVSNPNNAIDAITTNYSTLNIPVGLLGGSVYQQLIFPVVGNGSDSLRVMLGTASGLANVSLLGGVEITVANVQGGTTTINRRDTLANLLTLQLLQGSGPFTVTIPASGPYNTVQIKLTGVANLLNNINIYGVRAVAPNPKIVITNNGAACQGQTATITANGLGTASMTLYTDSTGMTVAGTKVNDSTFTTPTLTTTGTVTYFAQITDANGCANPERLPVRITVNPLSTPADIIVSDTTTACTSGNAVITPAVNPTSNITQPVFTWYLDAAKTQAITNGTVSGVTYNIDSTGKLTVSGLAAGTYTYYVAVAGSNRCSNAPNNLKAANVKIVTAPAGPVVPGTVVVATGQTASLTATPIPGATISWYSDSTATTPVGTGTPFVVGPFNNPGTYTYYAAVTIPGACESKRVAVAVVVTGPVIPSPDCNVPTSQVSGTSLGCILCSVQNPTNDIDSNQTNFTRLSMPVGLLGGSVYQQLIFPNVGSATDSIRINFAAPTGLADVSLLGGVVVTVYNNTTKVAADTLSNLLTLRLLNSQQFVATIPASAPYDRVEVRITGLANLLTSIDIYGARVIYPTPAVVTPHDTVCVNNKATLTVTPVNGTGVHWYADSTSTTVLGSNATYTTDSLKTPGTVTYWVAVYGGPQNCENPTRFPVPVVVLAAPQVPGADQNITACAGTNVSLQVIKPVNGLTYNWYNVATGGTKLNTDSGFVFKVNNVTADTTFYVEAQSSCGAVSTRQAYHILVGQALQPPVVSPNPDSVTVGATAVLTATLPVSNASIVWYGSQTGNDSLFTGTTFAAPAQSAPNTKVYWVQALIKDTSANICQSARVPVTVVTYQGDSLAVPCERAVTQTVGGSGLLILGNVYNPGFAVDDNQNTASSLVINLGALNATVWQRAGFTGPSAPGDSVRVRLSSSSQVLSAAVLASVQLTAYLGNTPVDSVLVGNPLLHVNLLNSGQTGEYTFLPKGTFDAVQVTLKSGVVGALTSINFNSARRIIAAPQVQASSVTVCSGSTATLNVSNPSPNVTYRWYTGNGTYLTGKDGASLTTGPITTDSTFYVTAFRAGVGCESTDRTAVNIKVVATPLPPVLNPDTIAVCPGSTASAAISNPVKGYSYSWYNVANGGAKLNTDSGFVFTVTNVTAPVTYYVEAMNDSCNTVSATRTPVLFTVTTQLGVPIVKPNPATVDTGMSAVLVATPPAANAKVKWYASQFATDSIFEGLQYTTVAKHTQSTDTLWVQASLDSTGTCTSQRIPVLIITTPMVPNPVPCERAIAQINSGTSVGGVLGLGTVVNPDLAVDNNTESASSLVLNVGLLGSAVWQRALFNGLSTLGDTVEVRLSNPSQVLSAALLAGVQLTSYNGNTPGDSLLVSNPLLHLNILNGTQGVVLSFVPTKQFDGIEVKLKSGVVSLLTAVDFNYARRGIVAPTIIAKDTSACVGTPITLSVANPVAGVTYSWYDQNNTKLIDSLAYIIPGTHPAGTYTYTVTATRDNCDIQRSAAVTVNILSIPAAPVADSSNKTSVCVSNLPDTLKVIAQPGVTYTWFDAIGNQLTAQNNIYIVPQGTAVGLHTYYVKANNTNGCSNDSARTQITLNVFNNAQPSDINIDTTPHSCAGDTIRLTPTSTTITNPVFMWYLDQQKTQPVTAGVDPVTGVLTLAPATAGTYVYYVSVGSANGGCSNQPGNLKGVTLTVNKKALPSDIQANDTSTCIHTATSITATSTTITNPVFRWYRDSLLTQFIRSTSTFVTDTLNVTTIYYVTVQGTNACENAPGNAKAVTVTVNGGAAPPVADTGNPASVCVSNLPVTLKVVPQAGQIHTWYDASGNVLITNSDSYTVPVGTAVGIHNYFVKTGGNTNCAGDTARTQITLNVFNNGQPSDINIDTTPHVCLGDTIRLTPTSTTIANPVFTWYLDQQKTQPVTAGVDSVTGVLTLAPATAGTYVYYVSVGSTNGSCSNQPGNLKAVTLTVNKKALASDIQANDTSTCIHSAVSITATSTTITNPVFRWYRDSLLTQFIRSTSTFVTDTLNVTTIYYVTVQGTNACENAPGNAKAVTVTVNGGAAPPVADTGNPASVCVSNLPVTLKVVPQAGQIHTWYDASGNVLITNSDSYTVPVGTAIGIHNYFVKTGGNTNCAGDTARTQITLNVFNNAQPSDINIDTTPHSCLGDTIRLTPTSTTIANPVFTWYLDQQKTQPVTAGVDPATGVLTLAPATAGTYVYYVSVGSTNGSCSNQPGNLKAVTLTVNKKALASDIQANDTSTCIHSAVSITATSTTITNPVFRWYRDAALTQFIISAGTFVTDTLSVTTTYYVTVQGTNACENAPGNAKAVTVTVNGGIAPPVADSSNPASVCVSNLPVTLKVVAQAGQTYTWYDAAGNQLVANSTSYTVPVGTTVGMHNYFVKANGAGSCAGDTARTQISINVFNNAQPSDITIDSVQNVCAGDAVVLTPTSNVANPVFHWYLDQQETQPITNGVNPATGVLTITNLTNGQYHYFVSVSSNGNCANVPGNLKEVTVNVGRKALPSDIQVNGATTCVHSTTTLTATSTTVTSPIFKWYRDAALTQYITSGSTFVTDTLDITTTYYVTVQGTNACENRPDSAKSVTVTVNSFTPPTVVGAAICAGQTALLTVSNPDPTLTYTWYTSLARTIVLSNVDSLRTAPLTADTTFYLQVSKGGCTLPLVAASVKVNSVPTPLVNPNQAVCSGSPATVIITAPFSGVVYKWYNVPTGGTALNTDAGTSYTTGVLTSSIVLYVEATRVTGCTGTSPRVAVTLAITPVPGAPSLVTNSQTVCAGSNVTFTVANPDPSLTYHWFNAAVNGTDLTPNGANSYTASNVTATTTYYVAAFNSAGCSNAGARTTATVTVLPTPPTPVINVNNQVACTGNPVTFNITNPDPALNYIWYNAITNDSLATGATFTTGRLTATTDYLVAARNASGCYSATKGTATATVVDSVATPNAGSNVTLCLGNTLNLAVINPVSGMIYHWYTSATSTTPIATGTNVSFNSVSTNTSYYVDASVANGNCVSTSRGRVDVTVVNAPAAPAVLYPAVTTCNNSNATLQVKNPDPTLTYNWYATTSGGTLITTGDSVTVGPITANTSYYVEAVSTGGCASPSRTLVSVSVGNPPAVPTVSGNDLSKCPGETYTLTAITNTPGAVFRWYATANGTTPVSTGAQFVTPPVNADVTYYVEASIGTGCTSASRAQAQITVLTAIAAPTVTVSSRTATSVTFTWPAVPGAQRYVVAVNDTTTFTAPSTGDNGTSHTVSNLQPNENVTLYVRAIGASSCQNSALASVTDKTTNPQGNNIYVPNLFSPNGDGVNDIEYVYGTAIAQLEFRIYNQWGQLVFTSTDQRKGWDGTMNGVKQPVGVYVWIVKATMQDGTVITKKGNVTLMR